MRVMDITDRHAKLLEAQNAHPPALTLAEMGEVLGIESSGHIAYILQQLIDEGLAVKIQRGTKHIYRFIEPGYRHNAERHE